VSELAVTRTGDGPQPLALLHGFLGSARNLATLAQGLTAGAPQYSVYAFDLRGHGASAPLPADADLGAVSRDLIDNLDRLGTLPWTLVGHSLGGRVALAAAGLAPARVAHLTLLDITPSRVAPGGETARVVEALVGAPDRAERREAFRAWFAEAGLPPPMIDWLLMNVVRDGDELRWRIDRRALAAFYPRINADDLWPVVESSRPYAVQLVRGGASPYVPDADCRRLEAAGARVDTVDGAGHFLHVDRPAETLERILKGLLA
jgi:pimeloyl-ACP methyl ester carboxylesterase